MPLELVDFVDVARASAPAGAHGVCTVAFDAVDAGYIWRVGFIAVQNTSTVLIPICQVFLDEALPQNQRGGSINGTMDTYDAAWPIAVTATRALVLRWTGADVASVSEAAIQYELYKVHGALRAPQPLY